MIAVNKFIYSENNIIGLLLLFIIFLDMYSNTKKIKFADKLFYLIIFSTALTMLTDITRVVLSGWSGLFFHSAHITMTAAHFLVSSIPFMAWSIYVDLFIHKDIRQTKEKLPLFAIPAVLGIMLSIFSLSNKGIFFIDANNIYQRGPLHLTNVGIYLTYFFGTYGQMLRNKKYIKSKDFYTLLFFGVVPMILGLVQLFDGSKSFIWLGVSISALLTYLNIQNSKINEDYLTGLYNRRQLDQYLESTIRELNEKDFLFMIMADIDSFKKINDTYGHIEGDRALKYVAELLTATFKADDFIARYAGDEFFVIAKLEKEQTADKLVQRFENNLDEFNSMDNVPYDLEISLGYDIYNPDSAMDTEDFIRHIDQSMYTNKEMNKTQSSQQLN